MGTPQVLPHLRMTLDITYECNLSCPNCDRQCSLARTKDEMSVQQIEKFIRESWAVGYPWGRIVIGGGEPTLHLDVLKITSMVSDFSARLGWCEVVFLTNGTNPEIVAKLPKGVVVVNSKKQGTPDWHVAVNKAPIDSGVVRDSYPCHSQTCAYSLNKFGYYHSSVCSCVDRVFGFNIGVKTLQEAMRNGRAALNAQKKRLCRYCGYALEKVEKSMVQEMGSTWEEALRKYRENPPVMTVY